MMILGVAVLVADGSVIDQNGAGTRDQIAVLVFLVLSLILTPAAIRRLKNAYRS